MEIKIFLNKSDIKFDLDESIDMDKEVINISGCSTHPHNLYLQLLS